jgi:hypothetical protein
MMSIKPSKNSWCPCGSGKRYRSCCRPAHIEQAGARRKIPVAVLEMAAKLFWEKMYAEQDHITRFGHARRPIAVKVGETTYVAVGGSLYKQTRAGQYNFLTAIHDHALALFGEERLAEEEGKSINERHPALQWMHTFIEHREALAAAGNTDPRAEQIGAGAAWIRFAYDLYTIRDNAQLERIMQQRLLKSDTFQGARHELLVAALWITAGFQVAFEDETDNKRTHTEFIATDTFTSCTVAVEAKSRQRRGAHGFTGGRDVAPGDAASIRDIVIAAFQKKTGLPLYAFIDVNLPPADEETYQRWLAEIDSTFDDLKAEGYTEACPANITFFCNDPSHYVMGGQIGHAADRTWITHYVAETPRVPHPAYDKGVPDITRRLMDAFAKRLAPPTELPLQQ